MVTVIEEEEEKVVSGGQRIVIFPKLEKIWLENLPKLLSFCEWKCDVELPSLTEVDIKRCPNMKDWSLGLVAAPNLEAFTTDLNNYLEIGVNVSFDGLKKLTIVENENPFYRYKDIISLFNGLEELKVSEYHARQYEFIFVFNCWKFSQS